MKEISVKSMDHTQIMKEKQTRGCHGCIYFLYGVNRCNWFRLFRFTRSKKIPESVLNKGCSHREVVPQNYSDPTGLIKKIIETFDGEII